MQNLTAWHYTTYERYREIFKEGFLQPSSIFQGEGIKPILWFSFNQDWEESANRNLVFHDTGERKLATKEEMKKYGGGLVRFGVHIIGKGNGFVGSSGQKILPWSGIFKKARVPKSMVKDAEKSFLEKGFNLWEWVGQFTPLSIQGCDEIQIMGTSEDDLEWRTIRDICLAIFRIKSNENFEY